MATYKGQDGVFQAITTGGTLASTNNLKSWSIEEATDSIETTVQSSQPVAVVRTSAVSNVAHGDTLAVSGTTYTVVEVSPDNEGLTQLRLRV